MDKSLQALNPKGITAENVPSPGNKELYPCILQMQLDGLLPQARGTA